MNAEKKASSHDVEVELSGLTKSFKNNLVVDNIDLVIGKGEFFSLLGPSGCGKTTTLRMIAGLEKPSAGKIFLGEIDVTDLPAYKRNVNTVFQDYAIFPHMDVFENIYYPLRMRNISRKTAEPKIEKILSLVNMSEYKRRFSSQLSGGQRQRIALARALVNEPRALLLDEPLGALDFKLRVAMQTALKDIQTKLNITFIYVTHDQTEAITMSDRIAVMKDGIIHQIGTPDEVYEKPKTPFVASFIGEMNFLKAKVIGKSDNLIKLNISGQAVTCKSCNGDFNIGDDVLFCIRPEKVHINPKDKVENIISSKLVRIIYRGNNLEIRTAMEDLEFRAISESKTWDNTHVIGENINFGWGVEDALIYPMDTKENILTTL
jgi:spermidine/putrescine transport system ATP-binding protein